MSSEATPEEIEHVITRIHESGFQTHVITGTERTIIGAVGNNGNRAEVEAPDRFHSELKSRTTSAREPERGLPLGRR